MDHDLVELRNRINKKRPNFYKQGSAKKKRIEKKWKFPRGSDNKIVIERKGYCKKVKPGYRGPYEARGLSRDGFNIVLINCVKDLGNINKSKDIICIAHVGTRKKVEIVKECLKQNLKILNLKNPQQFLADFEKEFKQRKDEKALKLSEKNNKTTEKKKGEKADEGIEAKVDKEAEKKEKDKLLTKREI